MRITATLLFCTLLLAAAPFSNTRASGGGPIHFVFNDNTGNNASIIFPKGSLIGFEPGDEIGVFNLNGDLAGSGVYEGTTTVIAAWGNDASSGDTEHMAPNEPYSFRVWKAALDEEFVLSVTFSDGPDFYTANGISTVASGSYVIAGIAAAITNIYAYPNPVRSVLYCPLKTTSLGMPSVSIYDLSGALLRVPVQGGPLGTPFRLDLDVSGLAPGFYTFRIDTGEAAFSGSFVKKD